MYICTYFVGPRVIVNLSSEGQVGLNLQGWRTLAKFLWVCKGCVHSSKPLNSRNFPQMLGERGSCVLTMSPIQPPLTQ